MIYEGRFVGASSGRLVLGECAFDLVVRTDPPRFIRGDANGDGRVIGQVTDPIYLLGHFFIGSPAPPSPFTDCGPSDLPAFDLSCADPPGACL